VAAVLKLIRYVKNPTPSIDAHLLEEQSYQISSRSDLKRRIGALGFVEEVAPCTRRRRKRTTTTTTTIAAAAAAR